MNKYATSGKLTVICAALTLFSVSANAEDLCIRNQSPQSLVMALDNPAYKGGGWLLQGTIESGQNLCCSTRSTCKDFIATSAAKDGKFSIHAFEDEDALEGCSILTQAGKTVRIDDFAVYDRCTWVIEDLKPSG